MLPLFKSHYSVGKSILTLAPAKVSSRNGSASAQNDTRTELHNGPASVFDIAVRHGMKQVILVEDALIGFLEAKKVADSLGIQLIFGLRIDVCEDMSKKPKKGASDCTSKIIIFAKNSKGCHLLNKIYSSAFTQGSGRIDFTHLQALYNPDDLKIAIPFYDSFLFHNLFSYKEPCIIDDSFFKPLYLLEDNSLPLDIPLTSAVKSYCGDRHPTALSKTIYYENREDFEAYQTYKCVCGRGFSTKPKTLDMPNLDHCGSPEFSFESYLENESS